MLLSPDIIEISKPADQLSALESDAFPYELISKIAERESWRKEVNRPIYHVHKWWAQRLGSVFRAIVLGAFSSAKDDVHGLFYSPSRVKDAVVFDPFMGSGTTVGEALKLGCRAIGRDINPVAYFAVRNALERHSREAIVEEFERLSNSVRHDIAPFYTTKDKSGGDASVLYYFWVKYLDCPACGNEVDLFNSTIFAKHAYPKKYPKAQSLCPGCGEVNEVRYDDLSAECVGCGCSYNPQNGPARGQKAKCEGCQSEFPIASTIRQQGGPPNHRLYAKLVLTSGGTKEYIRATSEDANTYAEASRLLSCKVNWHPIVAIEEGRNTNQVLNYGYRHWHEMFNDRQLLCLGMLADRISKIDDAEVRDAFTCLFSGVLEFNNMFASYKGEGTGAVRHMFAHHILKPERTPLEANPWGTPKSSGSFSGLFKSRLLRALDYADDPFEVTPDKGKVFGLSEPLGCPIASSFEEFEDGFQLYASCGDSAATDIREKSVDAIITDPPFFDNVNYSQLADFFFVWQQHMLGRVGSQTTRSNAEVQHQEVDAFSERLGGVFAECHRVLKDDGIFAFSYHHSRSEGWTSVLSALSNSGFRISACFPVKAEMSGGTPKNQAKEPIDLDIIIVCRKSQSHVAPSEFNDPANAAANQAEKLSAAGRKLSRNDLRIILMGQLLKTASNGQKGIEWSEAKISDWIEQQHARLIDRKADCELATT